MVMRHGHAVAMATDVKPATLRHGGGRQESIGNANGCLLTAYGGDAIADT